MTSLEQALSKATKFSWAYNRVGLQIRLLTGNGNVLGELGTFSALQLSNV